MVSSSSLAMAPRIILMLICFGSDAMGQDWASIPVPADPETGQLWSLDSHLSDDFNYDSSTPGGQAEFFSRWQDWKPNFFLGPGATYFSQDNWFVENGAMTIFGSRVPEADQIVNTTHPDFLRTTYTGYVTSKEKLSPGSYTEVRMKGGATPLSANFWMIDDTDTTEIDVLEIYGDTDWFRKNPRTNVHFQIRENGQVIANVANQMFHPNNNINYSETWHRYGVHWISETDLDFYYDGQLIRSLHLPDEIVDPRGLYLNEPVRLIMDLEAHHWRGEDGIPSDAELNDWNINNMQVDWVRTYVMAAAALCDFDGDGACRVDDLDALFATGPIDDGGVAVKGANERYDLDGNEAIDLIDRDAWLAIAAEENGFAAAYSLGDVNLDGTVDGQDFATWSDHKFTNSLSWSDGNFNGDDSVDGRDFLAWNQNKFTTITAAMAIPEPESGVLTILALLLVNRRIRSPRCIGIKRRAKILATSRC